LVRLLVAACGTSLVLFGGMLVRADPGSAKEITIDKPSSALEAIEHGYFEREVSMLPSRPEGANSIAFDVGSTHYNDALDPNAATTIGVGPLGGLRCITGVTAAGRQQGGGAAPMGGHTPLDETLAHEAFHCVESLIAGESHDYQYPHSADWVVEGLCAWVGLTMSEATQSTDAAQLRKYFGLLGSVFNDTEVAAGFFSHVQQVHGNLWHRIPSILEASLKGKSGNPAAFDAAGGSAADFLSTWGSSMFQDPAVGPEWTTITPISLDKGELSIVRVPLDASHTDVRTVSPYSARRYVINVADADHRFVHVQITGPARLQGVSDPTMLKDRWFCAQYTGQSCKCPTGSTPEVTTIPPISDGARLGIAGAAKDTTGSVLDETQADFCHGTLTARGAFNGTAYGPGVCKITADGSGYDESISIVFHSKPQDEDGIYPPGTDEADYSDDVTGGPGDYSDPQVMGFPNPFQRDVGGLEDLEIGAPPFGPPVPYSTPVNSTANPTNNNVYGNDNLTLDADRTSGAINDLLYANGVATGATVKVTGPFTCKLAPGSLHPPPPPQP
jgi:hypothetical protein